jgi:HK97 gp10 family phage protein
MPRARKRQTVKIEGGAELLVVLDELGENVRQALAGAAEAGANIIRDAANGLAPGPHVIAKYVWSKRFKKTRVNFKIGFDKEHWYYVFFERGAHEHGILGTPLLAFPGEGGERDVVTYVEHPSMAARPFLRPAMDQNKDAAVAAVMAALRAAILAGQIRQAGSEEDAGGGYDDGDAD